MPTEDQANKGGPEGSGRESALIIAGPTASGKSAMAMDVAERFRGTVINADSQQVYSELREVSARPSIEDEARVPHRLFGVMSGREVCSAGRWLDLAVAEIREALDAGRLPVLVGGTGMYLQSLTEGLSPIPDIPVEVRADAQARYDEIGAQAFHEELSKLDPAAGERLPVGDTQRLLRAWEVTTHTGRAFSDWRDEPRIKPLPGVRFATIALVPPRDKLYAGIDARFSRMVEEGALDEIRALLALDLDPGLPVMKALGVPELAAFVRGEMDLESAISRAQQVSRNYAKRQLTWVRNQIKDAHVLPAQYSQSFREEIFSFVHQFLLTEGA
ncbi:tRNA (adenosine(37)-N6)-dimethylallyltransferase MiaA [Pseudomonadota bacterium]